MTTTDIQANSAMGALHVTFSQYMQACIDASNQANIPFVLPDQVGQGKIIILLLLKSTVGLIIYYYIKLLIKILRAGWEFGLKQKIRNRASKLVIFADQSLISNGN